MEGLQNLLEAQMKGYVCRRSHYEDENWKHNKVEKRMSYGNLAINELNIIKVDPIKSKKGNKASS